MHIFIPIDKNCNMAHATEYSFELGANVVPVGGKARKWLAKLLDGAKGAEMLFWRDENGETIKSPPMIVITGWQYRNRTSLNVVVIGQECNRYFAATARKLILDGIDNQLGVLPEMSCRAVLVSLTESDYPRRYKSNMVISGLARTAEKLGLDKVTSPHDIARANLQAVEERARFLIISSLVRRCNELCVDIPPDEDIELFDFTFGPLKRFNFSDKKSPIICEVGFRTNLDIKGPWYVGNFQSYGYGQIRVDRSPQAMSEQSQDQGIEDLEETI